MNYEKYDVLVYENGDVEWYKNGRRHRTNGPAIEWRDGTRKWYRDGELHREDGPAIVYRNGVEQWFLKGVQYSEKVFNDKINEKSSCDGKIVEIDGKKYKLAEVK